jgi:hypothetical protein
MSIARRDWYNGSFAAALPGGPRRRLSELLGHAKRIPGGDQARIRRRNARTQQLIAQHLLHSLAALAQLTLWRAPRLVRELDHLTTVLESAHMPPLALIPVA